MTALSGCAQLHGSESGGGACAATLFYRHHTYLSYSPTAPSLNQMYAVRAAHLRPLGPGIEPPCNDTGPNAPQEKATVIHLDRIEGVDPNVEVVWPWFDDTMWLREGRNPPRLPRSWLRLFNP